ncbi:hypothetical protein [Actinomycetospora flava]|uniref:Uncharacterized protein n=1 Tax=Actinomycetospora flava TaxID=3129232 RepID=A0ABU8M9D2_9PSEU
MSTKPELGELREAVHAELDWLEGQHDAGFLGYAPLGWPAETWVLHGMWEDPTAAAPGVVPRSVEQRWRDEHPGQDAIGILVYESTPFHDPPPTGWRRLRWRELAARLGSPLDGGEIEGYPVPPSSGWFPIRSWPESIQTPPEGSLDPLSAERLLAVLAEHSAGGFETPCFCFYNTLDSPIPMTPVVLAGPLRAVFDAARLNRGGLTPDNIWPADRSWLLWTDYDLWGTRVIGAPDLVAAIEADPDLETIGFTYHPRPPRDMTPEVPDQSIATRDDGR